ncbi:MAG TPA: MnhB domain-containing protein [Actinocrinis sp.]|nr:MnhB domain-containing protein [Actinocrinis sp.]
MTTTEHEAAGEGKDAGESTGQRENENENENESEHDKKPDPTIRSRPAAPAGPGRVPPHIDATADEPHHRRSIGALLVAGTAAVLAVAFLGLPREHAPLPAVARYALDVSLPDWKLTEPVNEVVYGTRGFDTFGETFLLLAAVISVVLLTRSREPRGGYFGEDTAGRREQSEVDPAEPVDRREQVARTAETAESEEVPDERPATPDHVPLGTPAPEYAEAMGVVVRTAVRVAIPILAVTGCYLVAWGYSPGGGFPGGAVMLGVILLVYAGFGHRRISRLVRPGLLEGLELAGAALIILTELLGLLLRGSFSANWLPLAPPGTIRSGGVAQLFSAAELVEVGTGLTIVVFALLGMTHDWSPDKQNPGNTEDEDEGGSR